MAQRAAATTPGAGDRAPIERDAPKRHRFAVDGPAQAGLRQHRDSNEPAQLVRGEDRRGARGATTSRLSGFTPWASATRRSLEREGGRNGTPPSASTGVSRSPACRWMIWSARPNRRSASRESPTPTPPRPPPGLAGRLTPHRQVSQLDEDGRLRYGTDPLHDNTALVRRSSAPGSPAPFRSWTSRSSRCGSGRDSVSSTVPFRSRASG